MKGRIGRIQYLVIQVFSTVLAFGDILLASQMSESGQTWISYFMLILLLIILYIGLCSTIKRAHDLYPGVNPWLLFVPVYNINIFLILLVTPGKKGSNKYGRSPYAIKRKAGLEQPQDPA